MQASNEQVVGRFGRRAALEPRKSATADDKGLSFRWLKMARGRLTAQ